MLNVQYPESDKGSSKLDLITSIKYNGIVMAIDVETYVVSNIIRHSIQF